jgi:hypothetical protein
VRAASAGAVPFLTLLGIVAGGWQMARAALIAQAKIDGGDNDPFYKAKIVTTRFYADHVLSQAAGLASSVTDGAEGVLALRKTCSDRGQENRHRRRRRQCRRRTPGHGPLAAATRPSKQDREQERQCKPTQTRPDQPDSYSLGRHGRLRTRQQHRLLPLHGAVPRRVSRETRLQGDAAGSAPVIINASCTFLVPLNYPGVVEVRMFCGTLAAAACRRTTKSACRETTPSTRPAIPRSSGWMWQQGKSVPIPDDLRADLPPD